MAAALALRLVNSWETIRCELLNTRICDFGLRIEGSPVERFVTRLHRELTRKGICFEPDVYLTDSWGCPDRVPVIGVPFYLADRRLARLEEEQTGDIEDAKTVMMLLRHEAGHAINYAYRLYRDPEWTRVFGSFTQPYREAYRPNPFSKQFVRHLAHHRYGRTYAQKHPDEDFAETFAVWLTPRSDWRRRYRHWPALRKLRYVDRLMKVVRDVAPKRTSKQLCTPVEQMDLLLADHYGQRLERYRAVAQGYVDDKLREIFPRIRCRERAPVGVLLRRQRDELLRRVTRWSGLEEGEVGTFLAKLEDRAVALDLQFNRRHEAAKLLDLVALVTAIALDFAYTGRLTG